MREEHLFCNLPTPALKKLNEIKSTAVYPKSTTLFIEGQQPRGVFVLCAGKAKLFTSSSDGKTIITKISEAGDVLGVTIRPIRPEDEPLMAEFHRSLSDRTVYLRYFASLSLNARIAHERLLRICFGDYEREMVLIAEYRNPRTAKSNVVGVGRLNKLRGHNNEAEVAVLVSDECQNQGLGLELLRRVIQVARDEKLSRVSSEMLRDNLAMQAISKKLGFRFRSQLDSSSIGAVLDL